MVTQTPQPVSSKESLRPRVSPVSAFRPLMSSQSEGFGRRIYTPVYRRHLPKGSVFWSVIFHITLIYWLTTIHLGLFAGASTQLAAARDMTPIYYTIQKTDVSKMLPSVLPPGAGAKPGHGIHHEKPPVAGSTSFHPKLTVVLTPPQPDNNRQTIIQPASAPDLRITQDLKLPNILVGNPIAIAKPKLDPKASKGTLATRRDDANPDAPTIQDSHNDIAFKSELAPVKEPHLTVPMASGAAATPARPTHAASRAGGGNADDANGANGLLVVSVDPPNTAQLAELIPGQRYGAFTISPAGGQPGSPGGVAGGDPHGGTGGPGTGGNGSVGVGTGSEGGGGGGAGGNGGFVSIKGSKDGKGGAMPGGELAYNPENTVYVVAPPPGLRGNTLIVSAGPVGGGGLGVYGALKCGRVYSVFLPMPGKSWILQYCASGFAAPEVEYQKDPSSVKLDTGLVPPSPDEKYDFKRIPVNDELKDKMIVLRGVIGADGAINNMEIYRGIVPEMDSAALAAFTKWKFKPAMHENKPISVDVLIGVPVRIPAAH